MDNIMSGRFLAAVAVIGLLIVMFVFVQSPAFALNEGQSSATSPAHGGGNGPGDSSLSCEADGVKEVVACRGNRFATVTVYSDGTYELDWTEWEGNNSDVEGYTLRRQRLLHRTFVGAVGQGADIQNQKHFKPGSCVVGGSWSGVRGEPSEFVWRCSGVGNAYETPSGSPASPEILMNNSTATTYSGSLEMRGQRTRELDVVELPMPAPTSWDSVPNEVIVQEEVIETEIHLFYIIVQFTDSSRRHFVTAVDSASGFSP